MKHDATVVCALVAAAVLLTAGVRTVAGEAGGAGEPIEVIRPALVAYPERVELGKKLFFEPRLSRSGFISCNSCHNLSTGGADNLVTSVGHNWQRGPINSPTVLNSSLSVAQFWDGRAANLKEQAGGPIANPGEMASSHELAVEVIASIPGYVEEFAEVFGSPGIDIGRLTTAIAAFEETLVTPASRFDLWLLGDDGALSTQELYGYQLFKSSGCAACHHGPAAGGTSFQKMGIVEEYRTVNPSLGRAAVTGEAVDRFKFKVPTLRNVELTYPYFHDGAAATLDEAVVIMGRLQLGRDYGEQEVADIVAFLKTLTGRQPGIVLPVLPPSSNATPRPRPFE